MFANKIHEKAEKALKEGKLEKAIELYTAALAEHPNHVDIISDRGVAYLNLNKKAACFTDLNLAITLQPNYAYRYACRAFAKKNFGDLNGAVEDYEKAIELEPNDEIAHNNLGLLLEQKGYQDEANKRFEQAEKLSKAEDKLLGVIDELDRDEEKIRTLPEQQNVKEDGDSKKIKEFTKLFTSVEQLKEFLSFIKNGFKIK
tara:strand:+ start:49395 stop:49997 length:603 start_codon:yes stop_codon:yes gene_type:complete